MNDEKKVTFNNNISSVCNNVIYGNTKENNVTGEEFTFEVWEQMVNGEERPLHIWFRYAQESARFLLTPEQGGPVDRRALAEMCLLSIVGKIGELYTHVRNVNYRQAHSDPLVVLQILGDICWYLARSKCKPNANVMAKKITLPLTSHTLKTAVMLALQGPLDALLVGVVGFGAALGFRFEDILGQNLVRLHQKYPKGYSLGETNNA